MSGSLGFTVDRLTARAQQVVDWLASGSLELYDAPRPAANGDALTTQTLLAVLTAPASLAVSHGVITALLTGNTIAASGIAAWGRFKDAGGVVIADADVGAEGSGAALQLNALDLVAGAAVVPVSFALSEL